MNFFILLQKKNSHFIMWKKIAIFLCMFLSRLKVLIKVIPKSSLAFNLFCCWFFFFWWWYCLWYIVVSFNHSFGCRQIPEHYFLCKASVKKFTNTSTFFFINALLNCLNFIYSSFTILIQEKIATYQKLISEFFL